MQANAVNKAMPQQLAYNCFPHIGSHLWKATIPMKSGSWLTKLTRLCMRQMIKISATDGRVPVRTGHSESIYIETEKNGYPDEVREILS